MKLFFGSLLSLLFVAASLSAQTNATISTSTSLYESIQMDLANGFLSRQFYELAIPEYQKYIDWFPEGANVEEARYRIADCLRGLGKLDEARKAYTVVQSQFPNGTFFARAAFRRGEMDWDAGFYTEALKNFSEAAQRAESRETRLTSRFYQARALMRLEKNQEALPLLRELAGDEKQNPYRGFALLELGRFVESSNEAEARILFARVLDTETSALIRAEGGVKAGLLEMKSGNWKTAAVDFERVRKLGVENDWLALANLNLLRSYYQLERYNDLLNLAADPKNSFPSDANAEKTLLQAHAQRLLKKYKEAILLYDLFLKEHPRHPSSESASYERLLSLFALNDPHVDVEAAAFLKLYPKASGFDRIVYLQADRAFRHKDYTAAARLYASLSPDKLDPALAPEILSRKAYSLFQSDNLSDAIASYSEFIERFPTHSFASAALFQRGLAAQKEGRLPIALDSFSEIVKRFPKASERESSLYRLALLRGELKQFSAMRDTFQQLAREYPRNTHSNDAAYWTGWSLFEEGKFEESIPFLDRARKADPTNYEVQSSSRILLARYKLGQRIPLLKEVESLSADTPSPAPEIYEWLATRSAKEGDYAAAERMYRHLIHLPSATSLLQASRWGLATSLAAQRKWKSAIEIWRDYLKDYKSPADIVAAKLEMARAHAELKEFTASRNLAEEILRLQPEGRNNALARMILGDLMNSQKNFAEAGKYYLSVAILYDDPEITPSALHHAIASLEAAGETNQVSRLRQELKIKYPNFEKN